MFDYLDKIRKKPRHTREVIAVSFSGVFTFVVLAMWWNAFTFGGVNKQDDLAQKQDSPLQALSKIVNEGKKTAAETVTAFRDQTKQLEYVVAQAQLASTTALTAGVSNAVYPEDILATTTQTSTIENATNTNSTND